MKCKRCGNTDLAYFYMGQKGYYCRKCIRFARTLLEEDLEPIKYEIGQNVYNCEFKYELTEAQKMASKQCLQYLNNGDVLLYCVCGAGKTEISVESISNYLSRGLKVCYAISRKEVVIELSKRFEKIFPYAKVTAVYGGHHSNLFGDLIVCTTHQLYRYFKTFDLLILDEVDAFPLKDNETLMNISLNSTKGRVIFSTATVCSSLKKVLEKRNYHTVSLYIRPSGKPLVVPKIIYLPKMISILYLLILLLNMQKQCIIFVPNINMCKLLYKIFSKIISCTYVYAELENRRKNINDFRNLKYKYIFATTVLERGITIKDINVVILNFDSTFDEANLVQMLGRVGRNINNPYGEAYIIATHFSSVIKNVMDYLKKANSYV